MDTQSSFVELTALPDLYQSSKEDKSHVRIGVVRTVDMERHSAHGSSSSKILDLQHPWMDGH
jgi:hypothetical protein